MNQTVNLKKPSAPAAPNGTVETTGATNDTLEGESAPLVAAPLRDWSGEILDDYEIGERLGVGGNGQVFRARHRCLDLPVALKILHSVETTDEDSIHRFRREAMASARLMHPNLVRATDAGIRDGHLFLVTDLVEGVDLNQLVEQHGAVSVANACELGRAACEGLEYLNQNNTVHRDIKPSNIMLDHSGQVRILDLGLAHNNDLAHSLTFEGQLMGTLDFMSPEQALSPKDVDFHADMYSLGCTLYFLLTGNAPFEGQHETLAAKLMAHMEVQPTPIDRLRGDIPKPVARIVMAMLEKEAADRPETFTRVIEVFSSFSSDHNLRDLVAGNQETSPAVNPSKAPSRKLAKSIRVKSKRRTRWYVVLGGMIAILVTIYWRIANQPNPTSVQSHAASGDTLNSLPSCAVKNTWQDAKGIQDPRLLSAPECLHEKGKRAWRFYLASPSHKAWVMDSVSGNYGYATARSSVEEAIRAARDYAGPTSTLYSVNGELVEQSPSSDSDSHSNSESTARLELKPKEKPKETKQGSLKTNKFFSQQ